MNKIYIYTPTVRLKDALKICGAVESGGAAKMVIEDGLVKVNAEICEIKGKQLTHGDSIEFDGKLYTIAHEDQ